MNVRNITILILTASGTSNPELWPAGKFQFNTGADACYACPANTFSTVIGAIYSSQWQAWENGWYSNPGSTSCPSSICGDGYFGNIFLLHSYS